MSQYKAKAACGCGGHNLAKGEVKELPDEVAEALGPKFLEKASDKQVKKADVKTEDPAEEEAPKKKGKK